jgi:hypothetical protein
MPPRRGAAAAAAGASPRGAGGAHVDSAPIFLTVGTTRFDALVRAADDPAFAAAAEARGYTSLTIQARSPLDAPLRLKFVALACVRSPRLGG